MDAPMEARIPPTTKRLASAPCGLVRLLWTTPSHLVPNVLGAILALPGKPHEDPGHAQRTARNLEQSILRKEQSEMEKALFQSWRDESDVGIVQEALKLLASVAHQSAHKEALQAITAARALKPRRTRSPRQVTLHKAWERVTNEEAPSGEPWQSSDNRETQTAREQLLGLQQTWVELEKGTRAAMLDAILEAVPAETLQNVAAAIAMAYNDVDSLGPPPSLLRLRIALREKNWEHAQEQGQEAQTDQEHDGDYMTGSPRSSDEDSGGNSRRYRRKLTTRSGGRASANQGCERWGCKPAQDGGKARCPTASSRREPRWRESRGRRGQEQAQRAPRAPAMPSTRLGREDEWQPKRPRMKGSEPRMTGDNGCLNSRGQHRQQARIAKGTLMLWTRSRTMRQSLKCKARKEQPSKSNKPEPGARTQCRAT